MVNKKELMEEYLSLGSLIAIIDEPNRSACKRIYFDNKEIFEKSKWSNIKHQAWEGWYLGHVRDIMNIAYKIYNSFNFRKFNFSLSDALLVLFLHDLEKPWKYAGDELQKNEFKSFSDYKEFIKSKIIEYHFSLSEEHWNWLKYVHGEWDDYDPNIRIQSPLAAFVHICDTFSARIWFDYPKEKDSW